MVAYEAEQWHDLFVAVAGAAAALGGLSFVAASLNLKEILATKTLPPLAARGLVLLLGLLVLSIVALTPGQPRVILGSEIAALGMVMLAWLTGSVLRAHVRFRWTMASVLLALASTLPMVGAGLSMMAGVATSVVVLKLGGGFHSITQLPVTRQSSVTSA